MKKVFILFFFGFTPFFAASSNWAADHTHFNTEKNKPGVFLAKGYRSNAEMQEDYQSLDKIPFGPPVAYYDSNLDGAVLAIVAGMGEAQSLRNHFSPRSGVIWIQWEMWVDQDLLDDLPLTSDDGQQWVNTKLFRLANEAKLGCTKFTYVDTVYANKNNVFDWEGEDCRSSKHDLIMSSSGKGDRWLRWTVEWDFSNKHIKTWTTTMDGVTTKHIDMTDSGMISTHMDGAWPLLHSTSRDHHPDSDHPTYIIAYRNVIVSTQPIAFTTGPTPPTPTTKGDVNSDGEINILDLQACVNHILQLQDYGSNADVTGDGEVNPYDIQELVNILME